MNLNKEKLDSRLSLSQILLMRTQDTQTGAAVASLPPEKGKESNKPKNVKSKKTGKENRKLTSKEKQKEHMKALCLTSDSGDDADYCMSDYRNASTDDGSSTSSFGPKVHDKDDRVGNDDLVLANIEGEQHSRILKVMPKKFHNNQFFFETPPNVTEVIYLPPSFSLDDHTANAEIRSTQWKNSSVIMPLDFVFLQQKSMIEDLFSNPEHPINDYVTDEKPKYVFFFGVNPPGSEKTLEVHRFSPNSVILEDRFSSVSNELTLNKTGFYI